MMLWRQRANRNLVFNKGPTYPFMVWVPKEHSFDPHKYQGLLNQTQGRNRSFTRIPVSEDWHIWGFPDKAALDAFILDLEISLKSSVDDGA